MVVVRLDAVSKQYRVPRHPRRTLKEAFVRFGRSDELDTFVALAGVTLQIGRGEAVGVIGANGSGKSTLFKIISGIIKPTSGSVVTAGRISPLIELSAGFHPELTGLENIHLNAAIYGLNRAEVLRRLDGILHFADIGSFIHAPVRVYSSGMMARLAFAVAVSVDAEILLVDEVLAVGDAPFQERCLARIRDLKAAGTTIVYVSHDLASVALITDRVILLERGAVAADGAPGPVIERYRASFQSGRVASS
jgi:ABC-type polysaccharide/polyol phosphate transport system ATPase subunit